MRSDQRPQASTAWLPILAAAGITLLLLGLTMERYGYHRDELYFLAAGQRLDWGFVDQPPLTPAVAALATWVFGGSLAGLRLLPALAAGAVVVLTGLIAREMGGGRFAQGFAALCASVSTLVLALGHMLATATFDLLIWVTVLWLVARILRGGDQRLWAAVGVIAGIGLLNKHLVLFLGVGIVLGLAVAGPRRLLRSGWAWVGVAVALAIFLPNLIWQATHGWPQVAMAGVIAERTAGIGGRIEYLAFQLIAVNPLLAPVWVIGLWRLIRSPELRAFRALAVAYLAVLAIFLVSGGRFYYLGGLYAPLLAAGAVTIEGWLHRRRAAGRPRLAAALTAGALAAGILGAPFSIPVLPAEVTAGAVFGEANPEQLETIGWPELVQTVADVYADLPPDERETTTIVALNYGQAGAIERFGPMHDLPQPHALHNSYADWGPPPADATTAVVVGDWPQPRLVALFATCEEVAAITNPAGAGNEEAGAPVRVCRDPHRPWSQVWPEQRFYS